MNLKLSPGSLFGESLKTRQVGSFKLSERVYSPGFATPKHSHKWPLFCYVIQGSYTETYGTKTRSCKPSTLLFHPTHELHAEHFHDSGGRSFIIEIEPSWLGAIQDQATIAETSADFYGGILAALGTRLYREFLSMDGLSPLVVEGLLLEMIGEASRQPAPALEARHPRWLLQAQDLLRECFAQHLTLEEIAKAVGVHRVHLAQAFHKHFQCTVGEYIRGLRVECACRQLATSSTSLVEIALAAGFADQSHFTRTFKQCKGMSPSQYRAYLSLPAHDSVIPKNGS